MISKQEKSNTHLIPFLQQKCKPILIASLNPPLLGEIILQEIMGFMTRLIMLLLVQKTQNIFFP